MLLYCGAYDIARLNLNGAFGEFLRTGLWAYSGQKDFQESPSFATASVVKYVTASFPPTFLSVGNADPLAPQSYEFADTLMRLHVPVETLFFPKEYAPPLGHEYQFDLETRAARTALNRSQTFLLSLR
jgi:acetyl esterase